MWNRSQAKRLTSPAGHPKPGIEAPITDWLNALSRLASGRAKATDRPGHAKALEERLYEELYPQLYRLAHGFLAGERSHHTLVQPVRTPRSDAS